MSESKLAQEEIIGFLNLARHQVQGCVIPECLKSGLSMAAVALAHNLNANLLRK